MLIAIPHNVNQTTKLSIHVISVSRWMAKTSELQTAYRGKPKVMMVALCLLLLRSIPPLAEFPQADVSLQAFLVPLKTLA